MRRVRCLTHVMGVPAGDGRTTVTYQAGEVVTLTEEQYDELAWRRNPRTREPWIVDAADTPTLRCGPCGRDFAQDEIDAHRVFAHRLRLESVPDSPSPSPSARTARCRRRPLQSEEDRRARRMERQRKRRAAITGEYECRNPSCERSFPTERGRNSHEGQSGHRAWPGPPQAPPGEFACREPGCPRSFEKDHGRRTHEGREHGKVYDHAPRLQEAG